MVTVSIGAARNASVKAMIVKAFVDTPLAGYSISTMILLAILENLIALAPEEILGLFHVCSYFFNLDRRPFSLKLGDMLVKAR